MSSKPRIIILGGLGFVGRNFVCFLVENNLCSKIRVVDKVPPQTGWLNNRHKKSFENSCIEFKSANLISAGSVEKAFQDHEGMYDYCINCAAETKYGQTEQVYKDGVFKLSINCAQQAAKSCVKRFIELSTSRVYSCDKKASEENTKMSPWTLLAKYKLMVEEQLSKVEGLDFVVVRPVIIYGTSDRQGLTPRLIVGAVYNQLNEKMKLLWTKDLKMNTVHVDDVCRALWHLTDHGVRGQVYNLADKSESSQGTITELVCEIFGIEHGYFGTIMSQMARLSMSATVEESNEKHMGPWSQACERDGINDSPLSPYLDEELLYDKHLSVDGSKIETTGFTYGIPLITADSLRKVVQDYVTLGLFPPSLAHA